MAALRVYYNSHFPEARHTFTNLKNNVDGQDLHIVASSTPDAVRMLETADTAFAEPLQAEGYVDWLLKICKQHGVDVFVPRREQLAVAQRKEEFLHNGTSVVVMNPETLQVLNHKPSAYRKAAEAGIETPPWREVASADEVRTAVEALGSEQLICKLVTDEAGKSYRPLLTAQFPEAPEGGWRKGITVSELCGRYERAAEQGQPSPHHLVMPYLAMPEISVDTLAMNGRALAGIPRVKATKVRELSADRRVLSYAARVTNALDLDGLANVQLRWYHERPLLLEVNSRSAAGSYQSKLSGVDVNWEAIRVAAGYPERPLRPKLGLQYTVNDEGVELVHVDRSATLAGLE